jgi:hypothetical protein
MREDRSIWRVCCFRIDHDILQEEEEEEEEIVSLSLALEVALYYIPCLILSHSHLTILLCLVCSDARRGP